MEPEATPRRKLRKIRRRPAYGTYGYVPKTPEDVRKNGEALRRMAPYLPYRSRVERPKGASRSRDQRPLTIALPRTRSREQSHAPRSTPKAAQRSGSSSGDSSDPPGSDPAALAALLLYLLRVVA